MTYPPLQNTKTLLFFQLASDALYYHSMHEAVLLHSEAKKAPILVYRFGFDRHKNRQHILGELPVILCNS